MKKLLIIALLLLPSLVSAGPESVFRDVSGQFIRPLNLGDAIKAASYTGTSTATSTFAGGIQASDFCTTLRCLSSVSGGGTVGVGTSTNPFMATYFVATGTTASQFPYASSTAQTIRNIILPMALNSNQGVIYQRGIGILGDGLWPFINTYDGTGLNGEPTNLGIGECANTNSCTFSSMTGLGNVAIGTIALSAITSGSSNFALGGNALGGLTTGSRNIAIGVQANVFSSINNDNIAIGSGSFPGSGGGVTAALYSNSGNKNIAIGGDALSYVSGSNNTVVGYGGASIALSSGIIPASANTLLGWKADLGSISISSSTAIGQSSVVNCSDCIVLGTNDTKIGIGTTTPYSELSVVGQVVANNFVATSSTKSVLPYASTTAVTSDAIYGTNLGTADILSASGNKIVPASGNVSQWGSLMSGTALSNGFLWSSVGLGSAGFRTMTGTTNQITVTNGNGQAGNPTFSLPNSIVVPVNITAGATTTSNVFVATSTTATSTFANGINLSGGCFAVSGTCVGGGSSTGASTTLLVDNNTFSGTNNFTANLGIGTSSPYAKLSVAGQVVARNYVATTTSTSTLPNLQSGGSTGLYTNSVLGKVAIGNENYDSTAYLTVNEAFTVQTGTGQDWFAVAGGNVTFNSAGGKTLAGGIDLGARFNIAPISDSVPTLAVRGFSGGVSDIMRVSSPSVTTGDYMIVKSDGKIGIGTTSPYAKLSVAGTVVAGNYVGTSTATSTFGGAIGIATTSPNATLGMTGGIGVNPTQLYLASSGNVGIGTVPNSSYKLDVTGNVRVNGTLQPQIFSISQTTDAYMSFNESSPGTNAFMELYNGQFHIQSRGTGSGAPIYFETSSSYTNPDMAITGGKVGIGTTSPYTMLGVAGTITANNINATSTTATSTFSGGVDLNSARVKQHLYPSFRYATSTAWTGSTTIQLGTAFTQETWNSIECYTTVGTVNVSVSDGTNLMNMISASSTPARYTMSTNNLFTVSEKRQVSIGTPASSPTEIACTVDKTINP